MDTISFFFQRAIKRSLIILCCGVLLTGCNLVIAQPTPTPAPQAGAAEQNTESEPIAIITYVAGDVWIEDAVSQGRPPGLLVLVAQQPTATPRAAQRQAATSLQPVRSGARVQVAKGGSVTLVCRNNHLYRVTGQTSVLVNGQTCNSGQALPKGSATRVTPKQGRLQDNNGSKVLEGETRERESDYGQLPIILSPRNTTLLDLKPPLSWVEVSGSTEYGLSLSGLAAFDEITVDADQLTCSENKQTAPNRVCTIPWPAQWVLAPGQRYFLTISARTGIAAPLRPSEASALRTLPAEEAAQVQREAEPYKAITVDPVTPNYLLADLYVDHGLLDAAIAAYVAAEAHQPSAVSMVTLGDLYLQVNLQRFAFNAYQRALDKLAAQGQEDPVIHAAAEFGIGLVYYSRANYKEAQAHLITAQSLYKQGGATEKLKDVQAALDATQQRLP